MRQKAVKFAIKKMLYVMSIMFVFLCGCKREGEKPKAEIYDLTVNYQKNPIGIETEPVFSWKMEDSTQGQKQTSYQIVMADSKEAMERKEYIWDSGSVASDCSVAIPYEGIPLKPETRYFWTVYVRDKDGNIIETVEEAYFETGLSKESWKDAKWIYVDSRESENISSEDTIYTISCSLKMEESSAGIIWGADTNCYGEYYLWAFDTRGDAVEFTASMKNNETILMERGYVLDSSVVKKEDFIQKEHIVKIEVKGVYVKTYLDEMLVAEEEIPRAKPMGLLGIWVERGAFYAYFDNLLVTDEAGIEIYKECFDNARQTIFAPFFIKTVDGWLKASSGILMVPGGEEPAPMFRKVFDISTEKEIVSARLYISSNGIFDAFVNGKTVSDEYFAPGASYYGKEVYYCTYDVTALLQKGENVIGTVLGHGRYNRAKGNWGGQIALSEKLVIRYEDGSEQTVNSDDTWKGFTDGPVRRDDLYWGEYYDANKEVDGWSEPGFADDNWQAVSVCTEMEGISRIAAESERVGVIEELNYISVTEPEEGCFVYDFGQNINGVCNILVQGEKNQVVILRYAEALNEEGMSCRDDSIGKIWTQNLYTAQNTDYYILKGNEKEIFCPQFVCRGFRYVQIEGLDKALSQDDITAVVLSTENKRTGQFVCSDERLNSLYYHIYGTQVSNYVDIPTDCPQRDERLAWTGDAQVFALTGSYNANIYTFMEKYLAALRAGQNADGSIQDIGFLNVAEGGNNGWGDAIIIIPWVLYQQYGNIKTIEINYDSMCAYMDYLVNTSDDFIRDDKGYADHNAVSCSGDAINNTAQCAYSARLLAKMCAIIGETETSEKYEEIYEKFKKAWQDNYLNEDGSIGEWLMADYTLGLAFNLYPEELEETGASKLNISVEAGDYHMSTGYVSTPYVLPVLCKYGYIDAAYKLIMQDTPPSWNAMFAHGGTTITEGWNTYMEAEDGSYFINGSLNHYALGSVGAWFYTDILGIKQDEAYPAYKHFRLEPSPGGELTYASGYYDCMYGRIESSWMIEDNEIIFHFVIPANTSASVTLPGSEYQGVELDSGEYEFRMAR